MAENDYETFLSERLRVMNLALQPREIAKLHIITNGSPLFTDSVLRLLALGDKFTKVVKDWEGTEGRGVREAALRREIQILSPEARRVLLVFSYTRESSLAELRQVTGYQGQVITDCIRELQGLFLVGAPTLADEPRFAVSSTTALLVIESRASLVADHESLRKAVLELAEVKVKGGLAVVGMAIRQAMAQLGERNFEKAIATVRAALKTRPGNPDLLLALGRCLKRSYDDRGDTQHLRNARDVFRESYDVGQRKPLLFDLWFQTELTAEDHAALVDVANAAVSHKISPLYMWRVRRAQARRLSSNAYVAVGNVERAEQELADALEDLTDALELALGWESKRVVELTIEQFVEARTALRTRPRRTHT